MPKRRNNRRKNILEAPDLPVNTEEFQTDVEMVRAKLEDLEREKISRVQNLIQMRLNMENQLRKHFELSLLSLSPEIRDMAMKTFTETCNCDFEDARRVVVNSRVQSKLAGFTPSKTSGKSAVGENRRPPSFIFQTPHVSDKKLHTDIDASQNAPSSVLRANISRGNNAAQAPMIELTLDDGETVKLGQDTLEGSTCNMDMASRQLALQRLQLIQNSIQQAINQMSGQQKEAGSTSSVNDDEEKMASDAGSKPTRNKCPVPLAPTTSIPRTVSKTKGKGGAAATLECLRPK